MSIQRYEWTNRVGEAIPSAEGQYVLYADHVAAVAVAEQQVLSRLGEWQKHSPLGGKTYAQGAEDERARIRQAVEAMPRWWEGVSAKSRLVPIDRVLPIIDGEGK